MNEVFLPYRLVAAFADGSRLYFDDISESRALAAAQAAQAVHGDITWFDGVTDANYDHGLLLDLLPPPPEITLIDLREKEESP